MKSCPACQSTYPSAFTVCPQDATPLVEVGAWSEGTAARGKYRILSKVGQGGMGAVCKALHVRFDERARFCVIELFTTSLVSDWVDNLDRTLGLELPLGPFTARQDHVVEVW